MRNIYFYEIRVNFMSAYVNDELKKGFILDEGKLRKINEIIKKRIEKYPDAKIIFKIFRSDSFTFNTYIIDDIFKEDNDRSCSIIKISISVNINNLQLDLEFDKEDHTTIHIEGTDRDEVYLLHTNLIEYMKHEVNKFIRPPSERIIFNIIPTLFLLFYISYTVFSPYINVPPKASEALLNSSDINEKLNYLIRYYAYIKKNSFSIKEIIIIIISISLFFIESIWNFLFKSNLFLIGKEIENYNKWRNIRGFIFGGIILAIIIGIISNFLFSKFFKI